MSENHCLLGKTITALQIASDKKALRFLTDDGEIIARTDGDCCSSSWVEAVETPARGFPAKVLAVESLDLPDPPRSEDGWGDVIVSYGCLIKTEAGDMVIEYRNASNGYYGGSLEWPDSDYFYGGVHGQNVSNEEWGPLP